MKALFSFIMQHMLSTPDRPRYDHNFEQKVERGCALDVSHLDIVQTIMKPFTFDGTETAHPQLKTKAPGEEGFGKQARSHHPLSAVEVISSIFNGFQTR